MRMGTIAANRRRSAGATWTPASYFTGGVDGAYWDASDLSTMIKGGADGSVPVTTNGDPVGQINDKSGNGYHLVRWANTDAYRPAYTTGGGAGGASPYLDCDGSSSGLNTAASFAAKSQPHFIAVAAKFDSTGTGMALSDGVAFGQRAFMIRTAAGDITLNSGTGVSSGLSPGTSDVVCMALFNGASSMAWVDGTASSAVNAGTNQITGLTFGCDRLGGSVLDGRIYAMIWIPGTPDATLRANILTWLGSKQGRTL